MRSPAIRIDGAVLARRGQILLDSLDLSIPAPGVTALMGPNGAGKSLTLRLIAGLIAPDRGAVSFCGGRPAPRDLAIVFQAPVLLRRSARANLMHALAAHGVPWRQRRARAESLLAAEGMAPLADRPARRLSGGEQQRLAMLRALAARPRFLLLDEPTASLDPQAAQAIEALILAAGKNGTKVVLVTHDRHQSARLADDIVFLHRGRNIEQGPAAAFLAAPTSLEARAYLAGELLV